MRYIDNKELFNFEEMMENAADANDGYTSTYAYAASAYAAIAYDEVNVAYAACAYTAKAKHWINEYFKISGESKQDYINEVERLK